MAPIQSNSINLNLACKLNRHLFWCWKIAASRRLTALTNYYLPSFKASPIFIIGKFQRRVSFTLHCDKMSTHERLGSLGHYRYNRLQKNEIRLVRLLPGQLTEPILVELYSQALRGIESPKYEALSYAWGSRENPELIQIKDGYRSFGQRLWNRRKGSKRKTSYKLSVTRNLEGALRHLRRTKSARILWIDAICIDQSNMEERSAEVLRMGDIYHYTERVVIWLGISGPNTSGAWKFLDEMRHNCQWPTLSKGNSTDIGNKLMDFETEVPKRVNPRFGCCCYTSHMTGVQDLLSRPWFDRLWIWQERCLARTAIVTCGRYEMTWNKFLLGVSSFASQVAQAMKWAPRSKYRF